MQGALLKVELMGDQMASLRTSSRGEPSSMRFCPSEPCLQRLEIRLHLRRLMRATLSQFGLLEMGEDSVNVVKLQETDYL